jgi:hypothetical protein
MRILVCGGRDYSNREAVYSFLDALNVTLLIHGAAPGADTLADDWAASRNIPCEAYPANWDKYGKAAGSIRNQQMLDEGRPDVVVAFPGGRGPADMMARATLAGVPVWRPDA